MFLRAIIADSYLYLRVWPNGTQITVNYSATSDTEVTGLHGNEKTAELAWIKIGDKVKFQDA